MGLRKQYAEIAEAHLAGCADHVRERGYAIALACQELADRPPRELTDAEILSIYTETVGDLVINPTGMRFAKAIIAAHIAKQREPQVVKVRLYRHKDEGYINAATGSAVDSPLNPIYDWCSPVQEIEVRL